MTNDIQKQKPWTVNQVETEKPNAPRTRSVLSGYIGGSMNGGHNHVIAWKKVMAGEKHLEYNLKLNMQMLTPLTPAYQKLKCTIRTYFVPNSRVWKNAEKYTAQKGGTAEIKITERPNTGGKIIKPIPNEDEEKFMNATDTDLWRNSFISSYYPRMGDYDYAINEGERTIYLPKLDILPLRGRIAIHNDYERNKEYDSEIPEYNDDEVSNDEWNMYCPYNAEYQPMRMMRAKRENNYYTDYRTDIQGFEESYPPNLQSDDSLMKWAAWESKIAEARAEANNAQKNDWDIIAEIRGSKVLTEGKVQLIGKKTFNVNYSAITQNAYNTNNDIQPEFQVMGKQGAYSYTEVNIPLYAAMEFKEEGYIHIIATVSADTVFETGIDRNLLDVKALNEYRPDMQGDKFDTLLEIESGSRWTNRLDEESEENTGFKRRWSQLFKLPNVIQGDMTSNKIYKTIDTSDGIKYASDEAGIIPNNTYQFFEDDRYFQYEESILGGDYWRKKVWKDYTDLLINKNQAIKQDITEISELFGTEEDLTIKGQNQIFFVGVCTLIADLPVNEEIKKDFTTWGEH